MSRGEIVNIGSRMLSFELPGRRSRGRPKRRFMDVVKEDMKVVGVREEDAEDRVRWRQLIRCGDPWREKPKGKEEEEVLWQNINQKSINLDTGGLKTGWPGYLCPHSPLQMHSGEHPDMHHCVVWKQLCCRTKGSATGSEINRWSLATVHLPPLRRKAAHHHIYFIMLFISTYNQLSSSA